MSTTVRNTVETKFTARDMASNRFSRMRRSADALRRSVVAASKGIALVGAGGAAAAVVAVRAFNRLNGVLKEVATRADELGKFATQVNITERALHRLEVASGFVGASWGSMSGGIERFSVEMDKMRRGEGGALKALESTAPAFAAQLQATQNNTEALELYLGYLADLPEAQKMAAAAAVTGRGSASDFVRMVAGGREAIDALMDRVDRVRPFQDELSFLAAEYNDAWLELEQTTTSVKENFSRVLFPVMTEFALKMAAWIQDNRDQIEEWARKIEGWIERIDPEQVAAAIQRFLEIMEGGITVVGGLASAFGTLADAVGGADRALIAILATWAAFKARGVLGAFAGGLASGVKGAAAGAAAGGATSAVRGGVISRVTRTALGRASLAGAIMMPSDLADGTVSDDKWNEWMRRTGRTQSLPVAREEHRQMLADMADAARRGVAEGMQDYPFSPNYSRPETMATGGVVGGGRSSEAELRALRMGDIDAIRATLVQHREVSLQGSDADRIADSIASSITQNISGALNVTTRILVEGGRVVQTGVEKTSRLVGNVGVTTPISGPQ